MRLRAGLGRRQQQRSTTTAMVRDVPMTVDEYIEAIRSSLEYGDWWPEIRRRQGVRQMVAYC